MNHPSTQYLSWGSAHKKSINIHEKGARRQQLTQGVGGIDLEDQPAVDILFVGAEDGEDGALLPGFREEPVHKHWLLGEGECFPGLSFVGAVPAPRQARHP